MQDLRPLGAGELLDRAVTVFVRRFVPIVAVLAVTTIPLLVLQALLFPNQTHVFNDLAAILRAGSDRGAAQRAAAALARDEHGSRTVTYLVLRTLVRLVLWSALIAVIAAAYRGARLSLADAYRVGLARWPAQLAVGLAFVVLGALATLPALVVYVLVILVTVGFATVLRWLVVTLAVGVVGGVLVFALFVATFGWMFMAYNLAAVAVVDEGLPPIVAIGAGLRRAFGVGTRWRTLVAGLVVALVTFVGTLPLLAVAAFLTAATHLDALYYAIAGAGQIVIEGLAATFVVAYARDMRIRREGLDLALALQPESPLPA